MVKTTIDPSTPISTTQIVQTKRRQAWLWLCHLLENDQFALNHDNKRFSILATARSSFHLNLLEATYIKTQRSMLSRQKSLFTLWNSFHKSRRFYLSSWCAFSGILLLGNLSLARYMIGLSWLPNVQINDVKHKLITRIFPFWRDTATDESVTKSLWLKQLFSKLY